MADEDRWELGVYFPQFSPFLVYDADLELWYREGSIRPLRWLDVVLNIRIYYEREPRALPIVRVAPEPPENTPHLFLMQRNGHKFKAICYTFAPDGTWVRGRFYDDTAAEVLRQTTVWLLRYMVWRRFGFFPGADVGHDAESLLRETGAADPCPLHPWRSYGACCRPQHQALIAARQSREHLRRGILDPRARMDLSGRA